ncbi:MAG: branched-chain amino acid ABC transporter permease [Betaproteobacteria bacterium]
MTAFIQYTLSGLVIGGLYAIVALGFYIMWSAVRAVNFAHGDTLMLGSVLAVVLMWSGVPLIAGIPLAIVATAAFGVFIERVAVRPLNHGPASIGWMLSTIAVGLMLEALVTVTFGSDPRSLPSPLMKTPIAIGGAGIFPHELLVPVVAVALLVLLDWFYRATMTGRAMRAIAQKPVAAGLMGIDVRRMALLSFSAAAALGAFAGILAAPIIQVSAAMGLLLGLKGFLVAIIAGMSSARGIVVVGFAYGVLERFIEGFGNTSLREVLGFGIMILLLLVFPNGLFGKREVNKV